MKILIVAKVVGFDEADERDEKVCRIMADDGDVLAVRCKKEEADVLKEDAMYAFWVDVVSCVRDGKWMADIRLSKASVKQ